MRIINQLGDKIAVGLSLTCAIHCFLTPILLVMVPSLKLFPVVNDADFHFWMLFAVLPISLFTLFTGYKKHNNVMCLVIGSVGLLVLVFGSIWGHALLGCAKERYLTLFGASLISFAHISNFLRCRDKSCCSHTNPIPEVASS